MLLKFFSYLFFTNRCKYCGELLPFLEDTCEKCKTELPVIKGEKCEFCGADTEKCICKKTKMKYDGITSPFYYEGRIETAIKNYKFRDKEYVANALAKDIARSVQKDFENIKFDFIDYIPFSKSQKHKRRYNPAGVIAKELSKELGIPLCEVLTKPFETESQHTMGANFRSGNVAGAYDIKENVNIEGKTILLVDDIKTTGSTLSECARVLKIEGADKVYCTVAAIASYKKDIT